MKEFSPLPSSFLSSSLTSSYPPFSLLSSHFFLHSFSHHFHSPSYFSSLFLHSCLNFSFPAFLPSSFFPFISPLHSAPPFTSSSPLRSSPLLYCLPLFSPFHPPLPFTFPLFPSFPSFFSPHLSPNPTPLLLSSLFLTP